MSEGQSQSRPTDQSSDQNVNEEMRPINFDQAGELGQRWQQRDQNRSSADSTEPQRGFLARMFRRGSKNDPEAALRAGAKAVVPVSPTAEAAATTATSEAQQIRDEAASLEAEAKAALIKASADKVAAVDARKTADELKAEIDRLKAAEAEKAKQDEIEAKSQEIKEKAYAELQRVGIDLSNKTVNQVMAEVTAKGWENSEVTKNYVSGGIEQAQIVRGQEAFKEIRNLNIDVNATTDQDKLMEQLVRDYKWTDDAKTREYVQQAIDHAKRNAAKATRKTEKLELKTKEDDLLIAQTDAQKKEKQAAESEAASNTAAQKAKEAKTKAENLPAESVEPSQLARPESKEAAIAQLAEQAKIVEKLRTNPEQLKALADQLGTTPEQLLGLLDSGLNMLKQNVKSAEKNPAADLLWTILFMLLAVVAATFSAAGVKQQ